MRPSGLVLAFSFAGCLSSQEAAKGVPPGGTVEIVKPSAGSQVIAVGGDEAHFVVALSAGRGAQILVFDQALREERKWTMERKPVHLAVRGESILAGYDNPKGDMTACLHSLDGQSLGQCVTGERVTRIVRAGEGFYGLDVSGVYELNFKNSQVRARSTSRLPDQAIPAAGSSGTRLVRLDPMTGKGLLFDTASGTERAVAFVSPQLEGNRKEKGADEPLIQGIFGMKDGSFGVVPGRRDVNQGLPIDRFDAEGAYRDTKLLALPRYEDTGALGAAVVEAAAGRWLLLDPKAGRFAWYEGME